MLLIPSNLPGVFSDPLLSTGVIFAFLAKMKVPRAVGPINTHSTLNGESPSAPRKEINIKTNPSEAEINNYQSCLLFCWK